MKRIFLGITLVALSWGYIQGCGGSSKSSFSGGSSSGGALGGAGEASGATGSGASAAGGMDSGGTSAGGSGGSGLGGASGEAGAAGGGPACGSFGDDCSLPGDCCAGVCEESTGTCGQNDVECRPSGSDCGANSECCSVNCDSGTCSSTQCVADGAECAVDGAACCSGSCESGSCGDVNGPGNECKSSGNPCDDGADCCSKLCSSGFCQTGSSFCVQLGDICTNDALCCSGSCNIQDGAGYGFCDTLDVGPERCKDGMAGMVCDGDCSRCCSRACGPGPRGVVICQPPSGCRPAGEMCRQDTDCCGGDADADLPGSGETLAYCERAASDDVFGRCRSQRCTPQGDVCQLNGGLCSESTQLPSNCCPTNANPSNPDWKKGSCEFDLLGIPRCNGLDVCRDEGESCASSRDCCDDRPCVPDPNDGGRLKCGGDECNSSGDTCTTNADCCNGTLCVVPAGEIHGTCGGNTTGGMGGTSGTGGSGTGGSAGTGGTAGTGGDPGCAAYGQTCAGNADCCFTDQSVTCIDGRCLIQN